MTSKDETAKKLKEAAIKNINCKHLEITEDRTFYPEQIRIEIRCMLGKTIDPPFAGPCKRCKRREAIL